MRIGVCLTLCCLVLSVKSYAKSAKIRWSPLKDAKYYVVEISRNGKLVLADKTTRNQLKKELPPGNYSFRVRATDRLGTEGQWTANEYVTIPLSSPKLTFLKMEKNIKLSWSNIPEANHYRLSITQNGKPFLNRTLEMNEFVVEDPPPGAYDWTVESILQVAEEPDFIGTLPEHLAFTINPPERKVAAAADPASKPESIISNVPNKPRTRNLFIGLNAHLLPYQYWTKESETQRVDAQGFSIDVNVDYRFVEKNYFMFRFTSVIQMINSTNHTSKLFDVSAEHRERLGPLIVYGGAGLRSEDWFHLRTPSNNETFSTLGPRFSIGVRKQLGKFSISGSLVGSVPLFSYGQSNSESPKNLDGLTLNLEPRGELGYQLTESFKLKGGLLWLPRHLNLADDYIENRGLSTYVGGQIGFD